MYSIFYYVLIYLLLAAVGMYVANKKVEPPVRRQRWLKYGTYVLITAIVIAAIFLHLFKWLSLLIVTAGFIEVLLINLKNGNAFLARSFVIYASIAFGFLLFSFRFKTPEILFIYFQVLIFDAFGQISGQLFGKNLLAPRISPTKTIEGLIGGWLFCIMSAGLGHQWVNLSVALALVFGLLTGATSFCGDMLASRFKRLTRIKDYSNWLPGQGGFLDRFDSIIFTGCVYWLADFIFKNLFEFKN